MKGREKKKRTLPCIVIKFGLERKEFLVGTTKENSVQFKVVVWPALRANKKWKNGAGHHVLLGVVLATLGNISVGTKLVGVNI